VIESEESCLYHARKIKEICNKLKVSFIFKSSFDKANRTSVNSFRGPGLRNGLKILAKVKKEIRVPILSDVHCKDDIKEVAKVLDIIQIPAFLSRQTDLILEVAKTKKIVNLKKGQFLAPWDIGPVIKKIESTGNKNILVTERGVSFGYNNLVSDLRALSLMRKFGYPVIFDATHSLQLPGGQGTCSGGHREFVFSLARAAIAFGCDGLFLEVHRAPDEALCDGPNSISLKELENILKITKYIDKIILENKLK
ncbi:MAG: 3-deoxy-8-phosphooctulonate synthase, partial [Candidatus Omnitrophota bacterium]